MISRRRVLPNKSWPEGRLGWIREEASILLLSGAQGSWCSGPLAAAIVIIHDWKLNTLKETILPILPVLQQYGLRLTRKSIYKQWWILTPDDAPSAAPSPKLSLICCMFYTLLLCWIFKTLLQVWVKNFFYQYKYRVVDDWGLFNQAYKKCSSTLCDQKYRSEM